MLTPEQVWLDRRDNLNLTELKACGDAMAQQLNTQRIMIEAQSAVKGRIRDEASKRGRDASSDVYELDYLIELIDAQQARIDELEENAEAHTLAMKAGKAMLQFETERADNAEALAESECAQNTSLLHLLAKIREACGDNGQRMQDELVAYIGDLAKDATSLRIFAAKVAKQEPEKPDYWSSCGQCERNAREAEDLIEVAPAVWPEDTSDYGSRIAAIGQNGGE